MNGILEAFPKDCKVRLSAMGQQVLGRRRLIDRIGVVKGYTWDRAAVRVLWEGLVKLQDWHRDYVERVDE